MNEHIAIGRVVDQGPPEVVTGSKIAEAIKVAVMLLLAGLMHERREHLAAAQQTWGEETTMTAQAYLDQARERLG